MDWSNLAYFAMLAAFVIPMMRGCGGGMCGMGRNRGAQPDDKEGRSNTEGRHNIAPGVA